MREESKARASSRGVLPLIEIGKGQGLARLLVKITGGGELRRHLPSNLGKAESHEEQPWFRRYRKR